MTEFKTNTVLGPDETEVSGTVVAADTPEAAQAMTNFLKDEFAADRKDEKGKPENQDKP